MTNRLMKDSGVEWIGEMPENWDLQRLKNILIERKENNKPIKTNNILSLTKDRGVIPYSEKGDIGNKSKTDLTQYKLAYPGDIVLNSMNVIIGSVGLSKYFGAVSPVYYMLRPRLKSYSIKYYNDIFQTEVFQKSLIGYGNGIMEHRMRIPMNNLNNVKLPIPPIEEQKKITTFLEEKVSHFNNILEDTKQSLENLKTYKKSLITETVTKGLDPNVEMIDSGIEWIGELPSHWRINRLKRLFEIKKNIANEIGYKVLSITQKGIKIKDIKSNEGQISSDYSKYQIVNEDDFAMNHMDLLTGWVDLSKFEGVTSPDYRVFKSKKSNLIDNLYFKYIFQLAYSNKIFYGLGQGVSNKGRWRLPTNQFLNFELPIPPIEEQHDIANFLNEKVLQINLLINQKEQLIINLESYKKLLIYEYVTGKKEVE